MLSIPHMIVVFIVVLVVFGPQKLPELAKGLGKLMAEFRKASTDFKSAFENEMRDLERQAADVERKKRELLAKANATIEMPATLATPSGAETQPAPAQLAETSSAPPTEGERVTEADAGAVMMPIVTPAAEAVSRSSSGESVAETATTDTTTTDTTTTDVTTTDATTTGAPASTNGSAAQHNLSQADADAITEKPQRTASDAPPDPSHDYKPA
jgi:sec-independent protein translocase protein TatB